MIRFRAVKSIHTNGGLLDWKVDFECASNQILAIQGPSGSGKTTLLRMLAGLTKPDKGYIEVEGSTWLDTSKSQSVSAQHRPIGFVFQDFALFPNLTVRQNIEYALQSKKDLTLVEELLTLMELETLQQRRPGQLSGGQQQRVALARAIARRPKLLLLDEPLSALDDEMRYKLQEYILKAHAQYKLTTIVVSHHLPEILRLADKVICLENGKVKKQGRPSEVFLQDRTSNKFRIIGEIAGISPADIVYVITVNTPETSVKIIATAEEAAQLRVGDKVMVASSPLNSQLLTINY